MPLDALDLQMEAAKQAQSWSTWVVGLGVAAFAGTSLVAVVKSFNDITSAPEEESRYLDTRILVIAMAISVFFAISFIAFLPHAISQLVSLSRRQWSFAGFDVPAVLAYRMFHHVPLGVLAAGQFLSTLVAGLFGLHVAWRNLFVTTFLPESLVMLPKKVQEEEDDGSRCGV